jgi:hypothetical protein
MKKYSRDETCVIVIKYNAVTSNWNTSYHSIKVCISVCRSINRASFIVTVLCIVSMLQSSAVVLVHPHSWPGRTARGSSQRVLAAAVHHVVIVRAERFWAQWTLQVARTAYRHAVCKQTAQRFKRSHSVHSTDAPVNSNKIRPLANYTDSDCRDRRSYCQRLRGESVASSSQRIPTAVHLCFLDRSRYYFVQIAPQLSSRGWVDPDADSLLLRNYGSAGNRTRELWICSQEM